MFKKIVLSTALVLCANAAFAADNNVYVGFDAGSTKIDSVNGRKGSFGAFGGYQFSREIAVEAGYRRLASFTMFGADVDTKQTALSLVASSNITKDLDFFGRVGYNKLSVSASVRGYTGSASDSGALFGLGLGYHFTENVSARVEWQRAAKDTTNLNAGLVFKF